MRDEHKHIEQEADPGADDAGLSPERKLVEGVALGLPGFAEADVRKADGAPCQNRGKTGNGLHPGKSAVLGTGGRKECEEAKSGGDDDGEEGAALAVDVGEEAGGLALVCKGREGA